MTDTYFMLAMVSVAFVADTAFVVHYSLVAPWWRGPIGRTLVVMSACLALIYAWTLVIYIWPHVPLRSQIRDAIFTLITGVTVWRYVALVRAATDVQKMKNILKESHLHAAPEKKEEERG